MGLIFGTHVKSEIIPLSEVNIIEGSTEGYIYLKSRILTCDEPNGNGDFLPSDEVKKAYKTFIGKIVDYNHDTTQILGKIIDAIYIEGKNGEHDSVDIICKIDKNVYPEHIRRILSGELYQMSMEAYAESAECGFCGAKFVFADPCEHIKTSMNKKIKAADGTEKLVYRIDRDLTFVGAGIVENPADKKAKISTVLANETNKKENVEKLDIEKTEDILKNINGYELMRIIKAIENVRNGFIDEIVEALDKKIDTPIFETELNKFLDKRLTAIELKEVKEKLAKKGKLIGLNYNAHLIVLNDEPYWLITKNGLPIFKASLTQIWGEALKKDDIEIQGMSLKEYAKSDLFRRRLLAVLNLEGIDYIKEKWGIIKKTWQEIINLKCADVEKWKKMWESLGGEFEKCVEKIKDSDISNPEAYCAWLEKTATGKWPAEKASLIKASRDEFEACINSNPNIEPIEGQTKEEAIEAYCFKKVFGIQSSLKDYLEYDLINEDVLGGKENFKSWLQYKITGKWPKEESNILRIKLFAKEFFTLPYTIQKMFYEDITANSLLKSKIYEFNIPLLASEIELNKLLKYGMSKQEIEELYNKRFGG